MHYISVSARQGTANINQATAVTNIVFAVDRPSTLDIFKSDAGSLSAVFRSGFAGDKAVNLIIAEYDREKLVTVSSYDTNVIARGLLEASLDSAKIGSHTFKAFVWDAKTLAPLVESAALR